MEQQVEYLPKVINFDEYAMPVERVLKQVNLIQEVMSRVMHEGEHWGKIPGCGDKPTLLKPGAEKISTTFRLAPSYDIKERDFSNEHREYRIICTLTHIPTGQIVGQGVGVGSTMEAKYRYRKAEQKCPKCGKETIIKGKKEYGGGWLCFQKKGGCGEKFKDGDQTIENQNMGRVEHDNPSDYYNTVLKMAKKRAHVDAVLTATAASDIFTQDVEDMVENGVILQPEKKEQTDKKSSPKETNNPAEPIPEPETFDSFMERKINEQKDHKKVRERLEEYMKWLSEQNGILVEEIKQQTSDFGEFWDQFISYVKMKAEAKAKEGK